MGWERGKNKRQGALGRLSVLWEGVTLSWVPKGHGFIVPTIRVPHGMSSDDDESGDDDGTGGRYRGGGGGGGGGDFRLQPATPASPTTVAAAASDSRKRARDDGDEAQQPAAGDATMCTVTLRERDGERDGFEWRIRAKSSTSFESVARAWALAHGACVWEYRFLHDGERVDSSFKLQELGDPNPIIDAFKEQRGC